MKKMFKNIFKFFAKIFIWLYKLIDKIIITPISKAVYYIGDKFSNRNGSLEKFLYNISRKNK